MLGRRSFLSLSSLYVASGCTTAPSSQSSTTHLITDSYTIHLIKDLTATDPNQKGSFQRLARLSKAFLKTPYLAHHLIGSATTPEKLVIDFRGVDCLSFLEYVTALNRSTTADEFLGQLVRTRYIDSNISFPKRRHFFTDWSNETDFLAEDVTATLSSQTVTVEKKLNQKEDGSLYLPGVPVKLRNITYIPGHAINDVLPLLKEGDLIGVYTSYFGLDVSHTGLVVCDGGNVLFRNASSLSAHPYVVDVDLRGYFLNKFGFIVLRLLC